MRVVVVSMVKNEADVIEAFCRHVAAFADHHLVFDHASTDGTTVVLKKLADEGVRLTRYTDDRLGHLQADRTNALMRRAIRDHGADWVIPLDADEFPQFESPSAFREKLNARAEATRPAHVWMRDYAPHPVDRAAEGNPVLRLRHRLTDDRRSAGKILVPRAVAHDRTMAIDPGNHNVLRDGRLVPFEPWDDVWYAHFPARNPAQVVVKILQGELQRRAGGRDSGVGPHYRDPFLRLATCPRTVLRNPYAYLRGTTENPAAYWGSTLRYPPVFDSWERAVSSVLPYVGALAEERGRILDRLHAPPSRVARLVGRLKNRFFGRRSSTGEVGDVPMREGFDLPDSRSAPHALACEIDVRDWSIRGATAMGTVAVRNAGPCVWRCRTDDGIGTVRLGLQIARADGTIHDRDYYRAPLPHDVEPGDAVSLAVSCPVPVGTGLSFRVDLVSEGVAWFDSLTPRLAIPEPRRAAA